MENAFVGNGFLSALNNVTALRAIALAFSLLFIPAFMFGMVSIWTIAFLFVFMHLGRTLCLSSLRRYEERLSYTNEAPKIKGIVIELCAYLALPFLAYILIVGDLNAAVSSGLDRAVIMSLPLEAIKLPIDENPSVFQILSVQQLLLSIFGFGGGMLYACKEIAAISLPSMPKNIRMQNDMTKEEIRKRSNLWWSYEGLGRLVLIPPIFSLVFAVSFFDRFWADNNIHVWEYVLVLPGIFLMPYVVFFHFFAIAINCITSFRSN